MSKFKLTASSISSIDMSITIMFFLFRKIPQIPNKKRVIETARYFTKSIILLFFMAVAITVTSAAVISMIVNSSAANVFQLGTSSLSLAESGAILHCVKIYETENNFVEYFG